MPLIIYPDDIACSSPYSMADMKIIATMLAWEKTKLRFPVGTGDITHLGSQNNDYLPLILSNIANSQGGQNIVAYYKCWRLAYLKEFENRRSGPDWPTLKDLPWPFPTQNIVLPYSMANL